mgnify:CR=1 FL=1
MASSNENLKFVKSIIDADNLLDNAIDWIQCNMPVEDVFPEEVLVEWAEEHGYVKVED